MVKRTVIMALGLVGYLCASISLVLLFLFLGKWFPAISIDAGPVRPWYQALAINLGLMLLWSVQHIGMAQRGFKTWILRWLPAPLERSNYVFITGVVIVILVSQWSPMPATVWRLESPVGQGLVTALFLCGWLYAIAGILYDSYFEFHGLEQAYRYFRGQAFRSSSFKTGFLFRLSRRPTFFGFMIVCWSTPHLTVGHLLFATTMTLFIFVGARSVERSYVENYGAAYRRVQADKPLFLPDPRQLWVPERNYHGAGYDDEKAGGS